MTEQHITQQQLAQRSLTPQQVIHQHVTEENNTQHNVINQHITHIQVDQQGVTSLSRTTTRSEHRHITQRILQQQSYGQRAISRSQRGTLLLTNRIYKLQELARTTNRKTQRNHIEDHFTETQTMTRTPGRVVPLILKADPSNPSIDQPSVVARKSVHSQPIQLAVPARITTEHADSEPIIRSLQHAIKSVEQDLNQAKEQWEKPSLNVNQLADQMFKEFSRRIRHEQQRRGL